MDVEGHLTIPKVPKHTGERYLQPVACLPYYIHNINMYIFTKVTEEAVVLSRWRMLPPAKQLPRAHFSVYSSQVVVVLLLCKYVQTDNTKINIAPVPARTSKVNIILNW